MENEEKKSTDWIKKHVDTAVILGGMLSSLVWMNGKFNDIENRLTQIETILIIKGIMPESMIAKEGE